MPGTENPLSAKCIPRACCSEGCTLGSIASGGLEGKARACPSGDPVLMEATQGGWGRGWEQEGECWPVGPYLCSYFRRHWGCLTESWNPTH